MARCKFCSKEISWSHIGSRWYPIERDGQIHRCNIPDSTMNLRDAVCMQCWLPLVSNRKQCICVSPVLIHKSRAKELRFRLKRAERDAERAHRQAEVEKAIAEKNLLKKARRIYKCVLCDGEAIKVGDSVVCIRDMSHTFTLDYYGGK